MKLFVRNYILMSFLLVLLFITAWFSIHNPRVSELNELLTNDTQLSQYPYEFKVISVNDKIVEIASPKTAQVPSVHFLRVTFPELAGKSAVNPEVLKAQIELAKIQGRAKKLVTLEPDVEQVKWVIDEAWYTAHGITLWW